MEPAQHWFVTTGSYPTRHGNCVRPLVDGEPAFRRICEAIDAARHSVWATITFMWPNFVMPDGRGSALDVLDRTARRGVDVRLIFWRPDEETANLRNNAFWGAADHLDLLAQQYPHIKVRWDRAHPGYCQHQKSWLIDATEKTATSFVGGINLNPNSLVAPGHSGEGQNHDIYVELAGPAVADVRHNFVQRWNEASERHMPDGRAGADSDADLAFPHSLPPVRGDVAVQLQRTTHPGRYTDQHPAAHGVPFDIVAGERTNLDQYCNSIRSARRSIYIENQALDAPDIIEALRDALDRRVEILLLMPAVVELTPSSMRAAERQSILGSYDNFTLCGIAGLGADGRRKPVHVHAKLMLADDTWATVGSCNLHRFSLFGNGELNVAFYDPATVHALRVELFREHLGVDTSDLDDKAALQLFRQIATANRARHADGDHDWQGLAFRLDPATYDRPTQI